MTVAELKEQLNAAPDDYVVMAFEQGEYYEVERIKIRIDTKEIEVM